MSEENGDQKITVRYATYIESRHENFLAHVASWRIETLGVPPDASEDSPYVDYTDIVIEAAFFGTGYLISSFPSLYDIYGKFMAGLDVDALYNQIYSSIMDSSEIANLVSAEAALLSEDMEEVSIPRLQVGMRDINSVVTSSFPIAKSVIEATRLKQVAKFSADMKYRMIPVVAQRWISHLDWNMRVVVMYAEMMKLYYAVKKDIENFNYSMAAKDLLWPFTVLDYERAALGAMQGATKTTTDVGGASQLQESISGTIAGAAIGAEIGGGYGAIIGGVIGLAASFA